MSVQPETVHTWVAAEHHDTWATTPPPHLDDTRPDPWELDA